MNKVLIKESHTNICVALLSKENKMLRREGVK